MQLFNLMKQSDYNCVLSISGIVYYYFTMQSVCWILMYCIDVVWSTSFPIHFKKFKASGKLKYFHIACISFCIVFPLITLLQITYCYINITIVFQFCIGQVPEKFRWIYLYPFMLITLLITSLFIVIVWNVMKVSKLSDLVWFHTKSEFFCTTKKKHSRASYIDRSHSMNK